MVKKNYIVRYLNKFSNLTTNLNYDDFYKTIKFLKIIKKNKKKGNYCR